MVCLTYHFFFVKALAGPKINIEITKVGIIPNLPCNLHIEL